MNRIRAVFYDMDNTLYPQIKDVEQRINYCIGTYSLPETVKSFWVREWLENGPLKRNLLDHVVATFNLEVDKEELVSAYRTCRTNLCLDQEVREYLMSNKSRGMKQFDITNGLPETQSNKIASLKLKEFMDDIIIARAEHAKPSGYWFAHVIAKYRLSPKECLSVGDWYSVDGIASLSAGISFLHIEGGPIVENVPPQICTIAGLTEMEQYLRNNTPTSREA
jgi:FMN phosphatase YigB (HAD superfamily)